MPSTIYDWSNLCWSIDNSFNDQRREEYDNQRIAAEAASRREYVYDGSRRQRILHDEVLYSPSNETVFSTADYDNYYTSQVDVTDENILIIRTDRIGDVVLSIPTALSAAVSSGNVSLQSGKGIMSC